MMPADVLFSDVYSMENRVTEINETLINQPEHPLYADLLQERRELNAKLSLRYGDLGDRSDAMCQARFGCAL